MASNPEKIIADLHSLRRAFSQNDNRLIELAIAYLLANKHIIMEYLKMTYKPEREDERRKLAKSHRELDDISADTDFHKIAIGPFEYRLEGHGRRLLSDDDLHQIIRGMEYSKYITNDENPRILLHPIDNYFPTSRGA